MQNLAIDPKTLGWPWNAMSHTFKVLEEGLWAEEATGGESVDFTWNIKQKNSQLMLKQSISSIFYVLKTNFFFKEGWLTSPNGNSFEGKGLTLQKC